MGRAKSSIPSPTVRGEQRSPPRALYSTGRVGEADGALLAREFGYDFKAQQFTDLANHQVLVKLLESGAHGEPFLATTLPPFGRRYGRRENLIRRSREKYGTKRQVVEDKIERWMRE